jgi:hypothetical protein
MRGRLGKFLSRPVAQVFRRLTSSVPEPYVQIQNRSATPASRKIDPRLNLCAHVLRSLPRKRAKRDSDPEIGQVFARIKNL